MEAAFCAYLGRGSEVSAQVLRGLQLAAWLVALVKWTVQIANNHPSTPRTALPWAVGYLAVLVVVWAGENVFRLSPRF